MVSFKVKGMYKGFMQAIERAYPIFDDIVENNAERWKEIDKNYDDTDVFIQHVISSHLITQGSRIPEINIPNPEDLEKGKERERLTLRQFTLEYRNFYDELQPLRKSYVELSSRMQRARFFIRNLPELWENAKKRRQFEKRTLEKLIA